MQSKKVFLIISLIMIFMLIITACSNKKDNLLNNNNGEAALKIAVKTEDENSGSIQAVIGDLRTKVIINKVTFYAFEENDYNTNGNNAAVVSVLEKNINGIDSLGVNNLFVPGGQSYVIAVELSGTVDGNEKTGIYKGVSAPTGNLTDLTANTINVPVFLEPAQKLEVVINDLPLKVNETEVAYIDIKLSNPLLGTVIKRSSIAETVTFTNEDIELKPTVFQISAYLKDADGNDITGAGGFGGEVLLLPLLEQSMIVSNNYLEVRDQTIGENNLLEFMVKAVHPERNSLTSLSCSNESDEASFNVNGDTGTFSWTPGFYDEGSYEITFSALYDNGLTYHKDVTITVTDTNRVPIINEITNVGDNGELSIIENQKLLLTVLASDEDKDNILIYSISGEDAELFEQSGNSFSWTPAAADYAVNNIFNISLEVNDGTDTSSRDIVITVNDDLTAPIISDGTLVLENEKQDSVELSWTEATDNVSIDSTLEYLVYYANSDSISTVSGCENNGMAFGSYLADINSITVTGLNEGETYYFNVLVRDQAGNKSIYSGKSTTILDTTPPSGYTVEINQPFINNSNQSEISFTFNGAEIATSYNYVIEDDVANTVTGSGEISAEDQTIGGINVSSLSDGSLTLSLSLTDSRNNQGNIVEDIVLKDTVKPEAYLAEIDQAYINFINQNGISFTFSGAEIATSYNYEIVDNVANTVTGSGEISAEDQTIGGINVSNLNDGNLSLNVILTDEAGNQGNSVVDTVVKDTVAPAVDAGEDLSWTSESVNLDSIFSDEGTGIFSSNWSSTGNPNISDTTIADPIFTGESNTDTCYTLSLNVTDKAGNTNNDTVLVQWDNIQTFPSINGLSEGWYYSDQTFTIQAGEDDAQLYYTTDNWGTQKIYTSEVALPIGEYTVAVKQIDKAGLISTTDPISLTIDKTVRIDSGEINYNLNENYWIYVEIDYRFRMGRYEVSNQEYVNFLRNFEGMGADGYYNSKLLIDLGPSQIDYTNNNYLLKNPWNGAYGTSIDISNYPVNNVSWYGAVAYCNWLSIMQGLEPAYDLNTWELISENYSTLEGYRLPSYDEHIFVALGGINYQLTTYPGSNDYDEVLWCQENSDTPENSGLVVEKGTHQVGQKAMNEEGVWDLAGNVSEWINDYVTNLSSDGSKWYGNRGCNWSTPLMGCQILGSGTGYSVPSNSNDYTGFRIVRTEN